MMKKVPNSIFCHFKALKKTLIALFCGDLQPVLTTDPKSTIKELYGSYWPVRGF
jgi:hypothetical protein